MVEKFYILVMQTDNIARLFAQTRYESRLSLLSTRDIQDLRDAASLLAELSEKPVTVADVEGKLSLES